MKKRTLSLLMVFFMLVSLFPAQGFAEEPEEQLVSLRAAGTGIKDLRRRLGADPSRFEERLVAGRVPARADMGGLIRFRAAVVDGRQ